MAAASGNSPQSEYIQHHLVHMNNTGAKQDVLANFGVINYDSVFWALLMGLITIFFFTVRPVRPLPGFQADSKLQLKCLSTGLRIKLNQL